MTLLAMLWIGIGLAAAGFIWMFMAGPSNAAFSGFVLMMIGFGIDLLAIGLWASGMIG